MELYLNEEKADVIKKYMDLYPLDGITTNPKMIGSLGKVNYADSLRTLRQAVGDKKLFTQVTSEDYEGILQEAEYICSIAGKDTYIKVMMALQAGADYVAVLYNYMVNVGYDASKTLKDIAAYVRESGCRGKLMGVGVRSQEQFSDCAGCGCQAINLNANNITEWVMNDPSVQTTKNFMDGWEETWGVGFRIKDFINK